MKTIRYCLLMAFSHLALSAGAIYNVVIDTSALTTGSTGYLYLQFNPGLSAGPASAAVTLFNIAAPGSFTGLPTITDGDVTGNLSTSLVLNNTGALNDSLNAVVFSTMMSFRVTVTTPPGIATAGSLFGFGLLSNDQITPLLTSDPDGFLGTISFDGTNAFTTKTTSSAASISSTIPEPSYVIGVFLALIMILWKRRLPIFTTSPRL